MGFDQLQAAMVQAGLNDGAYDLSYLKASNSVSASGPFVYVEHIDLIAKTFNEKEEK